MANNKTSNPLNKDLAGYEDYAFSMRGAPRLGESTDIISMLPIIVFAAAFGDYEIPMVLGNSTHRVLSIYTYLKYSDPAMLTRPESYVLMVVMIVVLMVVILAYRHLTMPKEGR